VVVVLGSYRAFFVFVGATIEHVHSTWRELQATMFWGNWRNTIHAGKVTAFEKVTGFEKEIGTLFVPPLSSLGSGMLPSPP
jgi:hypothetical protein